MARYADDEDFEGVQEGIDESRYEHRFYDDPADKEEEAMDRKWDEA